MKNVLLIDDSLTVQKVVSLTLDKSAFAVSFAKNRGEAMRAISDHRPDVILLSDQLNDVSTSTFPKEVEVWLGGMAKIPAFVLITGQDISEMKNFSAVLKKPFSPQQLKALVTEWTETESTDVGSTVDKMERAFNDRFSDESALAAETIQEAIIDDEPTLAMGAKREATMETNLWGKGPVETSKSSPVLDAKESMAYKAALEGRVAESLEEKDLLPIVSRVLERMMPAIIEKLVTERLDKLLKEQEQFMELNHDPS